MVRPAWGLQLWGIRRAQHLLQVAAILEASILARVVQLAGPVQLWVLQPLRVLPALCDAVVHLDAELGEPYLSPSGVYLAWALAWESIAGDRLFG